VRGQAGLYEKTKGGVETLYAAADNLPKIMGFYAEEAALIETGMAQAQAEAVAADRIRDLYPTTARMADVAKRFRGQPFLGQYFAFRAELFRTLAHRLRLIGQEVKSENPKVRAMGYKRLAGQLIAASLTPAVVLAWNALQGIDAEEDKDRRNFLPPWDEENEVLWFGEELQGEYFDLSDIDPQTTFTDPAMRVAAGADWDDALASWATEHATTFFGPSPISTLIMEAYRQETKTGRPIDNMAEHVWKAVQPGIVTWFEKEKQRGFSPSSLGSFALAKRYVYDVQKSLQFDIYAFEHAISDASALANRRIKKDAGDAPDYRAEQEATRREAFADLTRKVQAAQRLGLTQKEIVPMLDKELSSANVAAILTGRYIPYRPKEIEP